MDRTTRDRSGRVDFTVSVKFDYPAGCGRSCPPVGGRSRSPRAAGRCGLRRRPPGPTPGGRSVGRPASAAAAAIEERLELLAFDRLFAQQQFRNRLQLAMCVSTIARARSCAASISSRISWSIWYATSSL